MTLTDNTRQEPDILLKQIADYVSKPLTINETAYKTAHYSLFDALGCAIAALRFPDCKRLLGPIVNGQTVQFGAHVPGTNYYLDPVQAAFNIGTLVRWLDYNDTWLAAEWGHPSDNLGAILAVADYLNQQQKKLTMRDVLIALIKAYEIQGVLALDHSFNTIGLDHVILVKVASTALATHLFGGSTQNIIDALSQAWLDGQSLRTYRHAPNTGSRKSWAAGDATSRGVRLSMLTLLGEPGYPTVMTAPQWGFEDVYWFGKSLNLAQPLGTYVIENILYKVQYPAEFHAQTAVEAAVKLHPHVRDRLDQIERIEIKTQSPAMRIINKTGPLYNVADRDHCLQYMVAIGLIYGKLVAEDYLDKAAANPQIDELRSCMVVTEDPDFTQDYYDPNKRTIANAVQVFFKEGDASELVSVEAPLGHRWRREEAWSALEEKFYQNVYQHFEPSKTEKLMQLMRQPDELLNYSVDEFIKLWLV